MNPNSPIRSACSEEFEKLCALFTASALDRAEWAKLEQHIGECEQCRAVVAEYNWVASDGMAKIAARQSAGEEAGDAEQIWADKTAEARAKNLLLKNLKTAESKMGNSGMQPVSGNLSRNLTRDFAAIGKTAMLSRRSLAMLLPIAAVLVLGLTVGYEMGVKRQSTNFAGHPDLQADSITQNRELQDLLAQRDALNAQLTESAKNTAQLKNDAENQERALNQISGVKESLEQKLRELGSENQQKSQSLDSISAQRDALQRKLEDADQSLQNVRGDLGKLQEERQKGLLRTASLETKIDELSAELRESKSSSRHEEDFLASDRDIRDLIGARQLYIADVFDVDQNGQKRKPFGRVFYTKGKSLIFYAFDLDQQPNLRKAKAFQVWGSPGEDQTHAVSLGLFYMDSEANRRWVFKSQDPVVLSQVNSVFVTLEPKGESKSPSGKPILYAYLRTAPPNHP